MNRALEAAVEKLNAVSYRIRYGNHSATSDDARAIITAFLDAAAGDDAEMRRISTRVWHADEWPHDIKAAILALKEAVNG